MRKIAWCKNLAVSLAFSVAWVGISKPCAEAMLIPTRAQRAATAPANSDRTSDWQTIQKTLESKALKTRLHAMGLSDQEIQTRLSRLSDHQVHQLAQQIRAVHPAGDGAIVGLLVVVVLVLLIIFLIKRI